LTIELVGTKARLQQPLELVAPSYFVDPVAQEGKRMEPDSGLDFVVDDLPGIGRSYQMTGPTAAASPSSSMTAGAALSTAATPMPTRPRR
jgi:hypothetical protein